MKLKESMSTHPMTVRAKDELSAAYTRMLREGFRHLPVIDDGGNLVGVISDRDFNRAMWPMTAFDARSLPAEPNFRKNAKVCEYMSWPVNALSEDCDLRYAVELMINQKVSAIVITRDDEISGIITHEDLLKVLSKFLSETASLKDKTLSVAYNSPLAKVSELLATAGI